MSRQELTVPVEIEAQLDQLKAQLRQLTVLRGLGLALLTLIGGIGVCLALDLFWSTDSGTRTVLLGGVAALTALVVWRTLLRPLMHSPTEPELAAMVEHAHPQLRERLSSTIELATAGGPEAGSPLMRKLLLGQTVRQVSRIDFADSVSSERTLRVAAATAVAVLIFLAPFLMSPSGYGLLMSRFFAPWGNFESAGNLVLSVADGDRTVARGTDVPIQAKLQWRLREGERPETLWLDWTNTQGENDRRRMEFDKNAKAYVTTIPHVFAGFDFHVSSGRDRSREYRVTVVEAPALVAARMHVEPPAYTGFPAANVDGLVGEINVFERSRLALELKFNKPMRSARIEWFETEAIDAAEQQPPKESPLELAKDGRSGQLALEATFSGVFAIRLTDRDGLQSADEAHRVLNVQIDQPPSIAFADVDSIRRARPSDVIPVTVQAADDVGLGALELHYRIDGRPPRVLTASADALADADVVHEFTLDLTKLGVEDETVVEYRARAADRRTVPGPQEVWTDYRRLTVDKNASDISEQAVAARQRAMKEELEAIRKELETNRKQVAAIHQDAAADIRMQLSFDKNDQIAPRADAEMAIAQQLEKLAARFNQQPLYAGLTKKLQEVSRDELPPTSEKLKTATDKPLIEKEGVLKETVAALKASEQKLAEVAREFENLAQLETDLLELNRLAERVEQLASDAIDLDRDRRDLAAEKPSPETEQQQAALDNQQQALMQEQKDIASDFENLLEKRPELADAARKNELDQLKRLADLARAIAEPQDLLAEALANEAQESSQTAGPLAAKQEQLVRDAEELAAKVAADSERAPVKPIDLEQLRKLVEELKQGDLQEALDDQKAAVAEMERLAAELARNNALPADPQEALRELSKREEALQKKIAESKPQKPAENATPGRQKEFDKQQRALAAEQAAIEAGLSRLELPKDDRAEQQKAVDNAAETVAELLKNDPARAEQRAAQTKQALDQLAERVGSDEQRRQEAAREVAQLRKAQERLAAEARRQAAEDKPLEELAKRQEDLARRLADLPPNSQKNAGNETLQKAAEAIADLDKQRAQDVPASQDELQKSLERLEKRLQGEANAEEQVAALQKRQENVAEQAAAALKKNDDAQRKQQAQAQREVAEQLAKLDAPAAEGERLAAERAAAQAAEQLQGNKAAEKAPEALAKAQDALEQLAKAVTPNRQDPAAQAEQLVKRQQEAAQQAQQRAEQAGSETPAALRKAHEQRADVQQGLEQLRAGETAQAEKKEALDELRKASEAQQQLAQAAQENRKQPSEAAQKKIDQAKQQQARAEAAAADALARLQKQMQAPQTQAANQQAQQQAAAQAEQMRNQSAQASAQQAADAAEAAERLADEQSELRKQTAQAGKAEKPQDAAKKLAGQQQALEQQAGQLPSSAAPVPLAQARQQMAAARQALQQGNAAQAAQAQQRAEQALRDFQRQAQASAQQGEPASATDAQQLAARQQALSEELSRQLAGRNPQPANGQQPAANAARTAQTMQRDLAREAQRLALDAARETGAQSQAAQQATQLAQQATRASQQALGGQMAPASQTAQEAAATAQQAAQQAAAATRGNPNSNLAERAEDLATRQQDVARMLSEAAASDETRRAAQAQGQQQLAQATSQLAQGLAESARRLAADPLNLAQQGQQAAQAQQAAQSGQAAMNNSASQQQQGNSSSAASAAEMAARALEQAAQLASGVAPNQGMENNPVPNEVGGQVADAAEQLRNAQQQLAQSGQQGQPGTPQQGQAGNAQQGSPQQGTGQQGQPGNNQQSSLSQAASSLQQAAQALASAAQQLQSNAQNGSMASAQNGQASQQQEGQQSDSQSQAPADAANGNGAMVTVDLQQLQIELQKAGIRNWGELPGELKTEILQASRKRPRGDYAKLIQLYFEEIADAKARLDAKQKQDEP